MEAKQVGGEVKQTVGRLKGWDGTTQVCGESRQV